MSAGLRWRQQNLPLFYFIFVSLPPPQNLYLIRQVSGTCAAMCLDPLMEVLSGWRGVGGRMYEGRWDLGCREFNSIRHHSRAICRVYYEWHGCKIAALRARSFILSEDTCTCDDKFLMFTFWKLQVLNPKSQFLSHIMNSDKAAWDEIIISILYMHCINCIPFISTVSAVKLLSGLSENACFVICTYFFYLSASNCKI